MGFFGTLEKNNTLSPKMPWGGGTSTMFGGWGRFLKSQKSLGEARRARGEKGQKIKCVLE